MIKTIKSLILKVSQVPPFPKIKKPRHLLGALSLLVSASSLGAQLDPSLNYRTIKTEHFRVTYSPGLEEVARRAAGSAERAYANLSKELVPPSGTISLVVADNVDFSNGYATPVPSNRIVIFARPTIDASALRFTDDWVDLVVVHELAHIFHLDRARGLWNVGRSIFGRNPLLFPNGFVPSWISEGLAVHYESKLTSGGRLIGTDFDAIARAHVISGRLPALNALSTAATTYPLGNIVYTYGGPLMDEMARRKLGGMRAFVDRTAVGLPFLLNHNAKKAFGVSFDSVYQVWSDSTRREALRLQGESPLVKPIVTGGWFSSRPRWVNNDSIIWARADLKSVPALNQVSAQGGDVTRLSQRNTTDANTPLPDGSRVFAQQEFVNPYTQRTDLYLERRGVVRRLTFGARLMQPDARICGSAPDASAPTGANAVAVAGALAGPDICIVAVQIVPGGTRLAHVRVSGDSVEIKPLTEGSSENLLSEPRWSHSGDRIAATHWQLGGTAAIDILDANGSLIRSISRSRSVSAAPAWGPDDSTIYFSSDRNGRFALYRANVSTGAITRVAESVTGLFDAEPSPDGSRLATFQLSFEGYNLALVDARSRGTPADASSVLAPSRNTPVVTSDAPAVKYSAWRSVLPTWWEPLIEQPNGNNYAYGLATSGEDILGRHSWVFSGMYEPNNNEPTVSFDYAFAGFGVPVVRLGGEEFWDHFILADSTNEPVGTLRRRRIIADAALTFSRPRYRYGMSMSVGASYEWRRDQTTPEPLIDQLDPAFKIPRTYPSFFVSAAYGNTRQPFLALGPENGISLGATYRQRWRNGAESTTRARTLSGVATAYRGIDFGGWAHHLFAIRVAGSTTDATSSTEISAGGNSGGVNIAPGVTFGDGRRTFFVRGTEAGVQAGSNASAFNFEYRFPIALLDRGLWRLPFFFQRVSGVLFTDAATAWCPVANATSPICRRVTEPDWMMSAGAELHLDVALQYDVPLKFRFGVAMPTAGSRYFGGKSPSAYVSAGLPF
jgi:hypothetical protein